MTRHDWRDDAACLGEDLGWFFPVGETGLGLDQLFEAKRVCATCPVQEPCLDWAMHAGINDGVFGGLAPRERRALATRQRRRPTSQDTAAPMSPDTTKS